MPRRPNTRPTSIYWLFDMRPETIAKGWTNGYPFYCGKTVFAPEQRLREHKVAASRPSKRPVCAWVKACGKHIRAQTVYVAQLGGNWAQAERNWIAFLRMQVPICANTNDGGAGMPGYCHTDEPKSFIKALHKGRKRSLETRAAIARARTGKPRKLNKRNLAAIRAANTRARTAKI